MTKPILAITVGDPAGIGPEIAMKSLTHSGIYDKCVPVLIADTAVLQRTKDALHSSLALREIGDPSEAAGIPGTAEYMAAGVVPDAGYPMGQVSALCGDAGFSYVERGIRLAMEKRAHAVVTCPINKEAINLAGHHYSGHTEIFADYTGSQDYAMMLMSKTLKVIHVTTHVSMRKACDLIKKDRVLRVIRLATEALREIGQPGAPIAVAGLNAHSGESGLFGMEEIDEIIPAIEEAKAEGINVDGPVPPDTVFVKAAGGQYAIVVCMYHDQGHIPLKLSGFKIDPETGLFTSVSGINCTIGLPIIRTSVDHGTAFDRAGKGTANEESLLDAIDMAVTMVYAREDVMLPDQGAV